MQTTAWGSRGPPTISSSPKEQRAAQSPVTGNSKPRASPRGEKGANPTWGTQLARTARQRQTPKTSSLENQRGPDQETHQLQQTEKGFPRLRAASPARAPPFERHPEFTGKGAHLLTLKLRPGGQGPAGVSSRMEAGGCHHRFLLLSSRASLPPLGPAPGCPCPGSVFMPSDTVAQIWGTGLQSKPKG